MDAYLSALCHTCILRGVRVTTTPGAMTAFWGYLLEVEMEEKNNIRDVLVSYIEYVCDLEGTDFLGSNGQDINPAHMGEKWTPEQIAILQECRDEARVRGGW